MSPSASNDTLPDLPADRCEGLPRLLVVEDDERDLRLTLAILGEAGLPHETVRSTRDALRVLKRTKGPLVDAVLHEPFLHGEAPFQLLCEVRRLHGREPMIVHTRADPALHLGRAFDLGADEWLSKLPYPTILAERVLAAIRRRAGPRTGATLLRCGDLEVDLTGPAVRGGRGPIELTPRELSVLIRLANAGGTASRDWIAREVWGRSAQDSRAAADKVIRALRSKLAARSSVVLATVRGRGWRLVPTERARRPLLLPRSGDSRELVPQRSIETRAVERGRSVT